MDYDALHHPDPHRRRHRGPRQEDRTRRGAPPLPSRHREPDRPTTALERSPPPSAPGATAAVGSTGEGGDRRTPARVGFAEAFRLSFRPIHVRQDVAPLPWIATHTHALWVPILITVAQHGRSSSSTAARTRSRQFMFAYFIQTPAIGGVFIAGFLAPRASWLLGVVVGFVSAICYSMLVAASARRDRGAVGNVARGRGLRADLSPIIGAFFAAGAAWYRRFLALSSPNRGKRQSQAPRPSRATAGPGRDLAEGRRQALTVPAIVARRTAPAKADRAPSRPPQGHRTRKRRRHGSIVSAAPRRATASAQPAHAGVAELADTGRLTRPTGLGGHLGECPDRSARSR